MRHAANSRTNALNYGQRNSMISSRRTPPLLTAAAFVAILTVTMPAGAQEETIYIGGASPRGSVQVDMSVLDALGAPAPAGLTLRPSAGRTGSSQRIVLTPPGQKAPATQRRATAKSASPRKAPASASKAASSTKTATAAPSPTPPTAPKAAAASAKPQEARKAATPAAVASAPSDRPAPTPPAEPVEKAAPVPVTTATVTAQPAAPAEPKPVSESSMAKAELTASPAPAVRLPDAAPEPALAPAKAELSPSAMATPVAATAKPASATTTTTTTTVAPATVRTSEATTSPPVAVSAPPAEPTRMAALPPAPASAGKQSMRIAFSSSAATLPEAAKGELKQIAAQLSKDPALRVQVMAYAGSSEDASKARRLSLSRALAVRSYLIEQGIGSTRIDVRALGNNADGGPADRVDLAVVSR